MGWALIVLVDVLSIKGVIRRLNLPEKFLRGSISSSL